MLEREERLKTQLTGTNTVIEIDWLNLLCLKNSHILTNVCSVCTGNQSFMYI